MKARYLFLLVGVSVSTQAIDVTPYEPGKKLTVEQGKELSERYKNREKQAWIPPYRKDEIPVENKHQIELGIDLLDKTVATIGPKVSDETKRYSGNGLNCSSCHLKGETGLPGTKPYALPFTNVMNDYPNFRGRSMAVGTIQDRVNGCMTRSMGNGKPLPDDSEEMKAIVAYFSWLAKDSKKNLAMKSTGIPSLTLPDRKADIIAGKVVFETFCQSCHGVQGIGLKAGDYDKTHAYQFPPLGGVDSFNNGAGMSRLIKATRFIYANMPLGVDSTKPILTVDQAYDVAAYVESLPREEKVGRENDFPEPAFRPKDYPVPAYFNGDKAALEKAKYGPFN